MNRRLLAVIAWTSLFGTFFPWISGLQSEAIGADAKRPNIVWLVSEDNSPFLGCYGYPDAHTPHLDKLATEGIRYTNAFANAPVCAPARCTIITGMYATSLGTQNMRSRNFVPPEQIPFFTQYLRDAGYYCSNNSKTDYNLSPFQEQAWNQMSRGDHRQRKEGQPFFAVYNFGSSHESSLHKPLDKSLTTAKVTLPPYHPDTPETRGNWAMYHKILTGMDAQVGEMLARLESEGVADDTIVIYYADHGGILPRSKRFLYDSGVHVPMIVRFGKNFAHLAPQQAGSATDRLVSFVDLAPTVLSLAGIEVPEHLQGEAFLGKQTAPPREYVYCFRGRMDERYDMYRAVRDQQFKYVRNYHPEVIYGLHLNYLWKMPATVAWEAAYKAGKCNAAQSIFWETKPAEELYDTQADPWEVNNLAADPQYADTLKRMRKANQEHLLAIHDSGFWPEAEMVSQAKGSSIYALVRDPKRYPLEQLMAAAEAATSRDPQQLPAIEQMLSADHPAIRYWGAIGCRVLGDEAKSLQPELRKLLEDPSPSVQIAAADALVHQGETEQPLALLEQRVLDSQEYVALYAANVLENMGEAARPALPALQKASKRDGYLARATEYTVEKLSSSK
ncbi:sulfatase-like hydrolase/transferase [Lignipirellula cremea]|uniref:Arylsulfatase n=1 Tax=Lignipirellula cremea TaxID=2528010 RepID=A0A518DZ30_9BACT|nr:sulfatase-like hydrolase/transferase [Lignipirellula cremea]QDU97098.1 Arylsulfatase [Lignipirellula cremea]